MEKVIVEKNKNILKVKNTYNEEEENIVIDINTGEIMVNNQGVYDMETIKKDVMEILNAYRWENPCYLSNIIVNTFAFIWCPSYIVFKEGVKLFQLADSLDNLQIPMPDDIDCGWFNTKFAQLINDKKKLNDYIEFIKNSPVKSLEIFNNIYNVNTFCKNNNIDYSFNLEKIIYRVADDNHLGNDSIEDYTEGVLENLNRITKWANKRQFLCALKIIENYLYHIIPLYHFEHYCDLCNYFDEKISLNENNIVEQYLRLKKQFLRQKKQVDEELYIKIMDNIKDIFDFSYGDFTVVVPKNPDEIRKEGLYMHHCVADYAMSCADDEPSYIIFIRKKSNPNQCYITCQVDNEGEILQYYLARDTEIRDEKDIEFKDKLQEHLFKQFNLQTE